MTDMDGETCSAAAASVGDSLIDPSFISRAELERWTCSELSTWLGSRNAKKSGNKDALVNRICKIMKDGPQKPTEKSAKTHEKYCCVPNCHNTSETILPDGHEIMLHRLPAESKTRNVWLSRLRTVRKNLPINASTRVCSAHFEDYDKGNYPTIFPSKPAKTVKYRSLPHRRTPDALVTTCTTDVDIDPALNVLTHDSVSSVCPTCKQNVYVATKELGIQCSLPQETIATQTSFSASAAPDIILEDLSQSDEKVRFYTGFINFKMLVAMFHTLMLHGADRLNYWRGEHSLGGRVYHENGRKPGPKRALRLEEEFLLTCMRLRLGLMQGHLADIFKVSESTISRILNTWINFIYDSSKQLVPWSTKEQILYNLPRAFIDFSNTQIVLDCTEIFIEKPSSHVAQWQTWSEYKHHNTLKLLVGVTPNGTVNFLSRLWGGRASDRHITMESGVIPKIDSGMVIMADKGFTIEDLLPENIHLNMPPKIPSARPMSESEVFKTQHIASARIVVEMKMEQAKNYKCLQGIIPLTEVHLVEQMAYICFAWTNLLPPLFKK